MKKALKILFFALLITVAVVPAQAQRRVIHYLPNYENEPYHFGFLLAYNQMMYTIKTIENYQNIAQPADSWPNGSYSIPNTELQTYCKFRRNGFQISLLCVIRYNR